MLGFTQCVQPNLPDRVANPSARSCSQCPEKAKVSAIQPCPVYQRMIASEFVFNAGEGVAIFSLPPGVLVSAITRTTDLAPELLLNEADGGFLFH